ncbi:hypothetical protein MKX01_038646 [Papaver californicum]|nr:hypothetical protein MKX01_038646 [Papaver californicum]
MKNNKNKKHDALFTQQHRTLVKEGEKWIKEASQACSTLIATVMFAAAFTVPDGNDQIICLSIYIDSMPFLVFIVSDVVSLFASCTSIFDNVVKIRKKNLQKNILMILISFSM